MGRGKNLGTYCSNHKEEFNYQCPCGYKFQSKRQKFVHKMRDHHRARCKAVCIKTTYSTEFHNQHCDRLDGHQLKSIQI